MRYKDDLPPRIPDTSLPGGGAILARQPSLFCRSCGETWSAHPGDYWQRDGDDPIICESCDEPMVLVMRREVIVPWDQRDALRDLERALWDGADPDPEVPYPPCSHVWIDPSEPMIQRAPYSPVIGLQRREMKRGTIYECQNCGARLWA